MTIKERIAERRKLRAILNGQTINANESTLLLTSESIDDYIEHRIDADKVLAGILKDIQGNIAAMNVERRKNIYVINQI